MDRPLRLVPPVFCLVLIGCQHADPTLRTGEASDLVERHTGETPGWQQDWDASSDALQTMETLALNDAITMALRNNRALRADLETISEADADLLQAGLMVNPVISFMIMFPSGGGRTMLRGNALPMQPLQDLWMIPARKQAARAALQETILRLADRAVETVAGVKQAYVEVQYAQRALELITLNMSLVDQSTRIIEIRLSAGQAGQVEANLSRIRHERLRSDLLAVQTAHRRAQYSLLEKMGLPDGSVGWRVTPLPELDEKASPPPDEARMVLLAANQRLDLKSREWRAEAALREIRVARREGWPDLSLGFSFERAPRGRTRGAGIRALAADTASQAFVNGLNRVEPAPMVSQIAPLPRPVRDVTYTLGPMIELELPIFDWGQAQTEKAVHAYRRRLAEYDALLHEVVRTIRTTLDELAEAHAQYSLYRDVILPDVERNLELAQQSYVANQTGLTIYLQTQEDAISTRIQMLQYLRKCRLLEAELERAVGGSRVLDAAQSIPTTQTASGDNP